MFSKGRLAFVTSRFRSSHEQSRLPYDRSKAGKVTFALVLRLERIIGKRERATFSLGNEKKIKCKRHTDLIKAESLELHIL